MLWNQDRMILHSQLASRRARRSMQLKYSAACAAVSASLQPSWCLLELLGTFSGILAVLGSLWGHWGCLLLPGEAKARVALSAVLEQQCHSRQVRLLLACARMRTLRSSLCSHSRARQKMPQVAQQFVQEGTKRPANLLCPACTRLEMVVTRHRTQALLKEHWQLFAVRLSYPDRGHSWLSP